VIEGKEREGREIGQWKERERRLWEKEDEVLIKRSASRRSEDSVTSHLSV
jgi:hypothetical protein